jgi:hypothetical protein
VNGGRETRSSGSPARDDGNLAKQVALLVAMPTAALMIAPSKRAREEQCATERRYGQPDG